MVPVRALVVGDATSIVAPRDVEIRSWRSIDVVVPGPLATRPLEACRLGLATFETSPLLWADVLVVREPLGDLARALLEAIARDPSLLRGRELARELTAAAATSPRSLQRIALRDADAAVAAELTRDGPAHRQDPLASVVLVVGDEPADIVERAVESALGEGIEVVVAGGSRPRTPGVRWIDARGGWAELFAAAVDAASGDWIAPLEPASVFADGHVATLLEIALGHDLDVVYGRSLLVDGGEVVGVAGDWPPSPATLAHDAVVYSARLRGIRPDPGSAAEGEDPRWNLWRRWLEAGVRIANAEEAVAIRDLSVATRAPGKAA